MENAVGGSMSSYAERGKSRHARTPDDFLTSIQNFLNSHCYQCLSNYDYSTEAETQMTNLSFLNFYISVHIVSLNFITTPINVTVPSPVQTLNMT